MAGATIDQLQVEITAMTKDFNKSIDGIKSKLGEMGNEGEKTSNKVSKSFETIGKTAAIAVTAAGVAVAASVGLAVKSFANYEQLVGGVETLFKNSSDVVIGYANTAYKTAGLSANRYMETVTSFSASLLQGLGGDTAKAAQIADMAVTDMSDNANKMGTSIESIQFSYQGFAKDNYTMLDNLKLGYGGTQEEMARLVNDSGVLGKSFEATAENVKDIPFDQLILAIHKTQEEMGIAGTTSKEASSTISGAWSSLKGSFENVLTGVEGSGKALSDSVIIMFNQLSEKVPKIVTNMVNGMFEAIKTAISAQFGEGAWVIISTLAITLGTLTTAFALLYAGIKIATLVQTAFNVVLAANPIGLVIIAVAALVAGLVWFFTQTEIGRTVFANAMQFIKDAAQNSVKFIVDTFNSITGFFTDLWSNITNIFNAFVNFIKDNWVIILLAIVTGGWILIVGAIIRNWDTIVQFSRDSVSNIIRFFSELPGKISEFFQTARRFVGEIWSSIGRWFGDRVNDIVGFFLQLPGRIKAVFDSVVATIQQINWGDVGMNIIKGIGNGMSNMGKWLADKAKAVVGDAKDQLKSFLGIHSPSRVMRDEVGKMLGLGIAEGIDASTKDAVKSAVNSASSILGAYGTLSTDIPTSSQLSGRLEMSLENMRLDSMDTRPTHITVMVGEDTLVDKVVNGINNQSFMTNGTVIRV